MKRVTGSLIVLTIFATVALADLAIPKKSPKPKASYDTTLRISLKEDAKEATLIIPKNQVQQLRAALDEIEGGNTVAAASTVGFTRTQTIVSGLFLSLAIVLGGIWFSRSSKRSPRSSTALIIIAMMAGLSSATAFVYGNAGPPTEARSITGKMFAQPIHWYKQGWGKIKVETSDSDRDEIVLIVPDPKTAAAPEE